MVRVKKCLLFLGPKFWFLVQKSDFCHRTLILDNDPFSALSMTANFRPWERFFDFPFRSYSCFRKKILLTAQKVFPLPTVGFYCTVKALALSACRPFGSSASNLKPDQSLHCIDNHHSTTRSRAFCCNRNVNVHPQRLHL